MSLYLNTNFLEGTSVWFELASQKSKIEGILKWYFIYEKERKRIWSTLLLATILRRAISFEKRAFSKLPWVGLLHTKLYLFTFFIFFCPISIYFLWYNIYSLWLVYHWNENIINFGGLKECLIS